MLLMASDLVIIATDFPQSLSKCVQGINEQLLETTYADNTCSCSIEHVFVLAFCLTVLIFRVPALDVLLQPVCCTGYQQVKALN